jgi:outer membrane protein
LAKKAELSARHERVKEAKRAPWPKLRALGQGGWLEYTKHQGSGYNYGTGISLEIPLFRGFEYTYKKRLALAEEEGTAAELRELQESIALDVLTYKESVKAAQEAFMWSGAYLEDAAKSYDCSLENYKAGLHNIFDLIQSQTYLDDARIKRARAKTQWLVSLAELAFAIGSSNP